LDIFNFGVSSKNQIVTPTAATRQAKYIADVQPARDAINGVRTGAMKPPILEPVFNTPQAAPVFSPPASMVAAQKLPSEAEANPNEIASKTPTMEELDACVPRKSSNALRRMQNAGTIGLPILLPSLLIKWSENQPPKGVIRTQARNMAVV
jgi:hypothetical protein